MNTEAILAQNNSSISNQNPNINNSKINESSNKAKSKINAGSRIVAIKTKISNQQRSIVTKADLQILIDSYKGKAKNIVKVENNK